LETPASYSGNQGQIQERRDQHFDAGIKGQYGHRVAIMGIADSNAMREDEIRGEKSQ
jgi:hypothetical protein